MFSGKSTLLISQGEKHVKAGQKVIYIKPSLDDRYSETEVVTHDGFKVNALNVGAEQQLSSVLKQYEYDVVLIDEAQFLHKSIVNSVWWLLSQGKRVYVSGLDLSFLSNGFETMNELMAMADKVNKLKAVCEGCGADAMITGKRNFHEDIFETGIVKLGSKEIYIPLCRSCYLKHMTSGGTV